MGDFDAQEIVKAAVKTLHANCKDIGEKGRSDGELHLVLVEVVVIVLGWRLSMDEEQVEAIRIEFCSKVENNQGRPGHIETLLLRVAYERYYVDHRKLSAWGTACHNLVEHLAGEEDLELDNKGEVVRRMWAQRYVSKYGVEKLRRGLIDDGLDRAKRLGKFFRGR